MAQQGTSIRSVNLPVFVDTLLAQPGVRNDRGGRDYRPFAATLGVFRYARSLVTRVEATRRGQETATLLLPLQKPYQTFRTTVGRDDTEAANGAGLAYFEVWGDGRLLYKSAALRSSRYPVTVAKGVEGVRAVPEDVEVSVKGVTILMLVTRYAEDLAQQGRRVEIAAGCVWGDPRLIASASASLRPGNAGRTEAVSEGGVAAPPGGLELRETLRKGALQLCGIAYDGFAAAPEQGAPQFPQILGVPPLRTPRGVVSPVVSNLETDVRTMLTEFMTGARRGGRNIFRPMGRREAGRISATLPGNRPEDARATAEAARRLGMQAVLDGALVPPQGGGSSGRAMEWRLDLVLLDCERNPGTELARVSLALPAAGRRLP